MKECFVNKKKLIFWTVLLSINSVIGKNEGDLIK